MRKLVLFVAMTLLAPVAQAGEFAPREAKEPAVESGPAPTAKARPKARTVAKRTWRPAAKPKKVAKKQSTVEKRPMP
jgi:hypothetical protein